MMNELEQIQDTLAKLVALYRRACLTLTWTTPTDSDGGWWHDCLFYPSGSDSYIETEIDKSTSSPSIREAGVRPFQSETVGGEDVCCSFRGVSSSRLIEIIMTLQVSRNHGPKPPKLPLRPSGKYLGTPGFWSDCRSGREFPEAALETDHLNNSGGRLWKSSATAKIWREI